MSDRFAAMGLEQARNEARRLDGLLNAQRLVTALLDAALSVPYRRPASRCRSANHFWYAMEDTPSDRKHGAVIEEITPPNIRWPTR